MDFAPALAYIEDYWPRLIRHNPQQRDTLIGLPNGYLVPSDGPMFQEQYYWDSYFMSLGLVGTPYEYLIFDMIENLAYLFREFGLIPNASRYYFLSRSQPPFFTSFIWLAYDVKRRRGDGDAADFLRTMMQLAAQEHEKVWMGTAQPHHRQVFAGLSRYFDINYVDMLASCESGWDHSTRCDDRWLAHLPADLNSILYAREMDLARAFEMLGDSESGARWAEMAKVRGETIQRILWDESQGFFYDYDWVNERRNPDPSLAGFYALWCGLATPEQAERMVQEWLPCFEFAGGLVTTLREKPGRQWAYPNGWAPLQWIVTAGLDRYGYGAEARRIRQKWCANCARVFAGTGTMWEKYNVVDITTKPEAGLYGSMSGFGWSNAVFVDFSRNLQKG